MSWSCQDKTGLPLTPTPNPAPHSLLEATLQLGDPPHWTEMFLISAQIPLKFSPRACLAETMTETLPLT